MARTVCERQGMKKSCTTKNTREEHKRKVFLRKDYSPKRRCFFKLVFHEKNRGRDRRLVERGIKEKIHRNKVTVLIDTLGERELLEI